jgi:hypothetical protein
VSLIGPPFGVPGMRPVGVPHLPDIEDQRRLVARARGQARRWTTRGILLFVIAALAVRYGWLIFGLIFLALALLALELARSTRRRAAALADRLKAMEAS